MVSSMKMGTRWSSSLPEADLAIVNATVRTMDLNRLQAEAVAVRQNRIVAVGTSEEITALIGPRTEVYDAGRRLVLPGFNDAHVHFLEGGFSLRNVNLRPATSSEEFASVLGDFVGKCPAGVWVRGGNWDHESWPGTPLPTRALIDPVTVDHPVLVSRLDGHMALANSHALRLAGITRETKDPTGGVIDRERQTGNLTGILKDAAVELVARVIPPSTAKEKFAAAVAAAEHAASLGVTSVTDMSADADVGVYEEMLREGRLKTRIYAARSIVSWELPAQSGVNVSSRNETLRLGGLRGFADGSLGASTALFFEPYADMPATRGLLFSQMLPEGTMLNRVRGADALGFQVMIHAIGDEANARVLDIYEQVRRENRPRDRRFRIEHAQHLRREDIPRFGQLGIIASMQPYHAVDDGRWCEKRLGPERCATAYSFRALLDSGAMLAFGSDWTVAPLNPLLGIEAAVTRQTRDGKHPEGWIPEQKISVYEVVRAYTFGSAFAEFSEVEKGSISAGKLADLVILSQNIFEIPPSFIDQVDPVLTIMNGQIVYSKS